MKKEDYEEFQRQLELQKAQETASSNNTGMINMQFFNVLQHQY